MTRHELATDTATTLTTLNDACRTLITMGRYADAVDAAAALAHTANAYDLTAPNEDDDDE